jgi:hypothetical protein
MYISCIYYAIYIKYIHENVIVSLRYYTIICEKGIFEVKIFGERE